VTVFGIFLTPVFYYVVDWLSPDGNGSLEQAANPVSEEKSSNSHD